MAEITPLLVAVMAFGCVAIIVFVAGRYAASRARMQRRLPVLVPTSQSAGRSEHVVPNGFLASLAGKVDEKNFGIEGRIRTKLRRDLIRAGYFSDQAIPFYIFARIALVLLLPVITYIFIGIFFSQSTLFSLASVAGAAVIGVLGPDAYISRRQKSLQQEYRIVFPDLVDMIVVCSDAGLSLDAAFTRIQPEIAKESQRVGD